jgi:5-methylcytosine-specific restriction endonuclease McrA
LFRPVGRKRKDWKLMPTKGKNTSLDNLWRDCIRERAGGACEYCGKTTSLNSHHIFSRSNYNVRWDLSNGICLCVGHHIFGNFSAHKSPLEFCEWLKEVRGNDWYEALRIAAKQKVDLAQLKDNKKVELRNKLNELQRNKLNG